MEQIFYGYPDIDYAEYIHRIVESKSPCLFALSTDTIGVNHVVPVLGHTINSDLWTPEAERVYHEELKKDYIHSSKWVDHFIIHDDNFGMYLCLPLDSLKTERRSAEEPGFNKPKKYDSPPIDDQFLRPYYSCGLFLSNIEIPGYHAEAASKIMLLRYLEKLTKNGYERNYWLKQLYDNILVKLIVIRSSIIKKDDYRRHLNELTDKKANRYEVADIDWIFYALPDQF